MKKINRLIALLLTVGMLFTMVNIPVIAAEGGNMRVEMVVFRYPTNNPPTNLEQLEALRVKFEEGETLSKGEDIVIGVKYTGLQNITDYGYKMISAEIHYPYEYFEPRYLSDTMLNMLNINPRIGSIDIDAGSTLSTDFSKQFLPQLYTDGIYNRSSANDVIISDADSAEIIRGTYFYRSAVNDNYIMDRTYAITDDSGYFDFFRYNVKKATEGDAKIELAFNTISNNNEGDGRIMFGLSTYAEGPTGAAVESTSYESPKAFTDAGNELVTPLEVDIDDYSSKPVVEDGKTYDADGKLIDPSTLTVDALEDASSDSGEKLIPANTVISLYEATPTVADGVVTLAKNGAAVDEITVANEGGSAVFDLDALGATATTDYIVTATEYDREESKDVPVIAATPVLDIPNTDIKTYYDYTTTDDPKYTADSHVRVFEIGGEPVNEYSRVYLYDTDAEGALAVDTFGDDAAEFDAEGYIKVDLASMESDVTYYLTAEQDTRPESPAKFEIKRQSYAPNTDTIVFKNNAKKGTDHVLTVKQLLNIDGTTVEIKQGTKIKVYADEDGQTLIAEATAAADGSVDVTFSADDSGIGADTEKDIWISATEPDGSDFYPESNLVSFTSTTAENKIIGIIDPDTGAVIGDSETEVPADVIEAVNNRTDLAPVGDTIIIPAGTNETDFADFGLTTGKVAVLLENSVNVDGGSSRVIFVDITAWTVNEDLSSIVVDADRNAKIDSADAESQTYTDGVYSTLDFTAYADDNLVEPEGGLKATNNIEVTKDPVIIEPVDPSELETGEHTVPNPVIVPEGTTKEELAKFGLTGNQIAVKFSPAKDNGDGTTTDIAYVDIEWNYDTDLTFPLELDENNTDPTEYTLTGSFTADSLAAAGVVASDIKYSPETTIQVTAKPVATGVVDENNKIYPTPPSPETDVPTQEVIDDVTEKIANGEATPYKSVIYVTAGTTQANALAMLKADLKIPVIVYTKSTDGLTQSVEYVEVNWNTANVFDGASDPLTEVSKEYTVTGTLVENADFTIVPAIQQLTTTFKIVDAIEISMNNGNALDEDITKGFNESDIFVYYDHVFTDPFVSVKGSLHSYTTADLATLPEGTLTRTLSVIDSEGNEVPGSQVALPAYADNEALDQFALQKLVDYSKHYRITYTFTDPETKAVGTAERDVYAIYKRGDFDIDGVVGALDLSAIKDHQAKVSELDLSDALYKSKTANTSKSPDDKVGPASLSAMKDHQGKVMLITDDYATKVDGGKSYMVFSASAE